MGIALALNAQTHLHAAMTSYLSSIRDTRMTCYVIGTGEFSLVHQQRFLRLQGFLIDASHLGRSKSMTKSRKEDMVCGKDG